jgi:tetratricopeptide (TPR) repeat protein
LLIFVIPFLLLVMTGIGLAQESRHKIDLISDAALLHLAEMEFHKGKETSNDPALARKHFAAAARQFDALRRRGIQNPQLYRNLGNAEMLSGNLAGAIFSYRRGLRLAPNDRSLQTNLELARGRVHYPNSTRPADPMWLPPTSLVVVLALCLYAVAWAAWTRRLIKGRGTWRALALSVGAIVAAAACAWLQWRDWQEERYPLVVVARDGVNFQRGNGDSYPRHAELPALNEGMEARRLYQRGDWLHIQLPGGAVGWVRNNATLAAEPIHAN